MVAEVPLTATGKAPQSEDADTAALLPRRAYLPRRATRAAALACFVVALPGMACALASRPAARATNLLKDDLPVPQSNSSTVAVILGNGCFWERQWAYYVLETAAGGPFSRTPNTFTSKVGYAGGRAPPASEGVCYHTGDHRDYTLLGHAEANRVVLDSANAEAQMRALASDYFASFVGPHGARGRPDAGDRGTAYRSIVGLPGGVHSPLYPIFAAQNTFGMMLKTGHGGDADAFNTVWVYDTGTFGFYDGEVNHQNHCNFFMSEGMPYPNAYVFDVWNAKRASGEYVSTGCPESVTHAACSSGYPFVG